MRLIWALSPSPVRTAWAMQASLMTGSMPGMAASTSETWLLGSPPNCVEAAENNFALEATCACTSMPTTTSHSPVAPLMSEPLLATLSFCMLGILCAPRAANRGPWVGPRTSPGQAGAALDRPTDFGQYRMAPTGHAARAFARDRDEDQDPSVDGRRVDGRARARPWRRAGVSQD